MRVSFPWLSSFLPASLKTTSLPALPVRRVDASSHSQPPRLHTLSSSHCDSIASMVRKLALASLFFNNNTSSETTSRCLSSSTSMSAASFGTAASWQWPSCTQARTLSFRRGDSSSPEIVSMRHLHDDATRHRPEESAEYTYKTSVNPTFALDYSHSCSGLSDSSASLCTAPERPAAAAGTDGDEDEVIIHGLRRSNSRLFFEPESTSSIIVDDKQRAATAAAAFGGATALSIESADPYGDFRRSMEEMVLSHGVDDWGWLEEMLGWYLRANGKRTHGLIVGAFVDLLVALASSSSAPSPAASAAANAITRRKGKHQTQKE
ncbi:hypothetical protein U9M48_034346 [Paspalum notatum var. saurae]|uniref:Transcription repressor n=1 Tax=Paspalum notatum var. saurae TaxID=547442 RepID=A0AAQ3UCJ6_PASNO